MGKSTISMAIFNSYVKLPEGTSIWGFPPYIPGVPGWSLGSGLHGAAGVVQFVRTVQRGRRPHSGGRAGTDDLQSHGKTHGKPMETLEKSRKAGGKMAENIWKPWFIPRKPLFFFTNTVSYTYKL